MTFNARLHLAMARTGKSFHQLCREMGSAGGRRAAANKRRMREALEKFRVEQQRQSAMKLREADEVFSPQDRASIALDQRLGK